MASNSLMLYIKFSFLKYHIDSYCCCSFVIFLLFVLLLFRCFFSSLEKFKYVQLDIVGGCIILSCVVGTVSSKSSRYYSSCLKCYLVMCIALMIFVLLREINRCVLVFLGLSTLVIAFAC